MLPRCGANLSDGAAVTQSRHRASGRLNHQTCITTAASATTRPITVTHYQPRQLSLHRLCVLSCRSFLAQGMNYIATPSNNLDFACFRLYPNQHLCSSRESNLGDRCAMRNSVLIISLPSVLSLRTVQTLSCFDDSRTRLASRYPPNPSP